MSDKFLFLFVPNTTRRFKGISSRQKHFRIMETQFSESSLEPERKLEPGGRSRNAGLMKNYVRTAIKWHWCPTFLKPGVLPWSFVKVPLVWACSFAALATSSLQPVCLQTTPWRVTFSADERRAVTWESRLALPTSHPASVSQDRPPTTLERRAKLRQGYSGQTNLFQLDFFPPLISNSLITKMF